MFLLHHLSNFIRTGEYCMLLYLFLILLSSLQLTARTVGWRRWDLGVASLPMLQNHGELWTIASNWGSNFYCLEQTCYEYCQYMLWYWKRSADKSKYCVLSSALIMALVCLVMAGRVCTSTNWDLVEYTCGLNSTNRRW